MTKKREGIVTKKRETRKYQPHSKKEIANTLEAIATASRDINLSPHMEACLWNAIEILEDLIAEEM